MEDGDKWPERVGGIVLAARDDDDDDQQNEKNILYWGSLRGVVANLLECDIVVSSNSSPTITFTFELIPFGNLETSLSPDMG